MELKEKCFDAETMYCSAPEHFKAENNQGRLNAVPG